MYGSTSNIDNQCNIRIHPQAPIPWQPASYSLRYFYQDLSGQLTDRWHFHPWSHKQPLPLHSIKTVFSNVSAWVIFNFTQLLQFTCGKYYISRISTLVINDKISTSRTTDSLKYTPKHTIEMICNSEEAQWCHCCHCHCLRKDLNLWFWVWNQTPGF